MTVGSVTARSHGGLRPANIPRRPTSARVVDIRPHRVVRTRIPASVQPRPATVAQVAAHRSIARIISVAARNPFLGPIAATAAALLWNEIVEPAEFPGFDAFTPGWRSPTIGDVYSPGDYVPNPFDHGSFDNPPESLVDPADQVGFTIRYWGDFATNPYPDPVPATNWPVVPKMLPQPLPEAVPFGQPLPVPGYVPAYRPVPDRAPRPRPRPRVRRRARTRNNLSISIRINPRPGARPGQDVVIRSNVPSVRDGSSKAKPASQFVHDVLKGLANALGEGKEWIDILAEAAGYDRNTRVVPASIDRGHETAAKAYDLFVNGTINQVDFDLLAVLVIENEIEDFLIGLAGRASKSAAIHLDLTVGPQTGPAI